MFDYKVKNGTLFSKISKNFIFTVRVHNIFHGSPQSSECPIPKKQIILQSEKLSTLKCVPTRVCNLGHLIIIGIQMLNIRVIYT